MLDVNMVMEASVPSEVNFIVNVIAEFIPSTEFEINVIMYIKTGFAYFNHRSNPSFILFMKPSRG
jgi:hypothetical protein